MERKTLKILSVGNSFSRDTMELMPEIAKSLGMEDFLFANLYIGGCSINRHYNNAMQNLADYKYYTSTGGEWDMVTEYTIEKGVQEQDWDIISVQHGTGDGSRYTSEESYVNLPALIAYIKGLAGENTKIGFNMAWVADPESTHHEITSYGGDQMRMYQNLTELTKTKIATLKALDFVSPVGTAVQNARTRIQRKLTRDDFHLSEDLGRYIAGLTFLKCLCNADIDKVQWCPEGVSEEEREIAKKAANAAIQNPYCLTVL